MTRIGYTISSEEHGPNELVDYAVRAEEGGFEFASISDHYHPWISQQGNAPFVWSTLGGVARATDDLPVGIGVNCPIMRMHPAIVAQAAATAATMFEGKFFLGVGTGERLNEHVTGEHWPEHAVRTEMLEEAIEIIRKLWQGGQQSYYGDHFTVENARLYTLPEEPPDIIVSAYGKRAAQAAAELGDGFWSVGPQDTVETWEEAGGEGPRYSQMTVCYAEDEEEAIDTAHEWWPNSALAGELSSQLPTPTHFEQACQMVTREDIAEGSIVTDPDPETHIENMKQFADAGYDHVYVHQIGPDQESLFRFYEEEVLPEVL